MPTPKPTPVSVKPYLTIVPTRSTAPKQKTHANLGQAKNAINYAVDEQTAMSTLYDRKNGVWTKGHSTVDMAIYEWDSTINDWKLLYDIPIGTTKDTLPWKKGNK